MSFPVFDLHCDTALALLGPKYYADGLLRENKFHIDLFRMKQFPAYAQCFACFSSPLEPLPGKMTIEDMFEREISVLLREWNGNADLIDQIYTPAEIVQNAAKGKLSAILTIEGPAGFGYDPELLENLWDIGFRITTLGWNENNVLTGSHKTGGGLTQQGRAYVKEAQRLGMLVDVSHISDAGFWDIMAITEAPIIASHSNSRAVCDNSRNLTDEMFLAICKTGGVVGINLGAQFLGENATLDMVCDHILHFIELDPDCKHIGLGGDLDGVDILPAGFTGCESYAVLADRLIQRGLTETQVADIFWNNAFGVIERAVCNNTK